MAKMLFNNTIKLIKQTNKLILTNVVYLVNNF